MRLGTAIECLVDNYKYASDKEWINDKVAWALYHTWKEADRKDEPTISKMEQVDKDINVRSKDCETCKHYKLACELFSEICKYEPTTQTETQNSNLTFEKRTMLDCYNCKRYETEGECIECHYEPKDEPQDECAKEYEELGLKELKELIEADRKDEPQMGCAWK